MENVKRANSGFITNNQDLKFSKLGMLRCAVICCFCISFFFAVYAPATNASTLATEEFRIGLRKLFFVLAGIIVIMSIQMRKIRINVVSLVLAVWPFVYLFYVRLYNYNGISVGGTSFAILSFLYALQSDEIMIVFFKISRQFIVLMSIAGIICYLLYAIDAGVGYTIVPYYTHLDNLYYLDYKISYLYQNPVFIRLCGLFNEPGWYGTFIAFYLCADDLNIRKKTNWILIIAGVLTFSLAFYFIIGIYFIVRKIKSVKYKLIIIAIVLGYFFVLPNIHTGIDSIDDTITRMTISDGKIVGINRTNKQFDSVFEEFVKSPDLIFGKGAGYSTLIRGQLSIKTNILDYGIVGMFLLYVPLFGAMFYKAKNSNLAKLFLLCVIISMYQRPWIYELSNYMLTLSAISYILYYESETLLNDDIKD